MIEDYTSMQKICDYSDTDYKTDFWGGGKRAYEDLAERLAVRKLIPASGEKFLEIGGGFGRLLEEYAYKFKQATLIDYAPNLVAQAKEKVQAMGFYHVKAMQGNIYDLASLGQGYDCGMMIRVMHHIEDVPAAFTQINRALAMNGVFILEYANKRNLLEIVRFLLRKPNIRPFNHTPTKRGEGLFYNFHPTYIKKALDKSGFVIEEKLGASFFRNERLKKLFGQKVLAYLDNLLQRPLGFAQLTPSVILKIRKIRNV